MTWAGALYKLKLRAGYEGSKRSTPSSGRLLSGVAFVNVGGCWSAARLILIEPPAANASADDCSVNVLNGRGRNMTGAHLIRLQPPAKLFQFWTFHSDRFVSKVNFGIRRVSVRKIQFILKENALPFKKEACDWLSALWRQMTINSLPEPSAHYRAGWPFLGPENAPPLKNPFRKQSVREVIACSSRPASHRHFGSACCCLRTANEAALPLAVRRGKVGKSNVI